MIIILHFSNNKHMIELSNLVEKIYEIQVPLQSLRNIACVMSQLQNRHGTSQV